MARIFPSGRATKKGLDMISKEPQKLEIGEGAASRVYWLKPPRLHERADWRAAVIRAGGRKHGTLGLIDLLAHGVKELMAGEPEGIVEALLARVARRRDAVRAWLDVLDAKDLTEDERLAISVALEETAHDIAATEQEVLASWPPFAIAVAEESSYWQKAGIEAARLFVVKWEGAALPAFKRTRLGGVDDELLAAIPEMDLPVIGIMAQRLAGISGAERKNSSSPQATSSGGETSLSSNGATNGASPSSASSERPAQSPS